MLKSGAYLHLPSHSSSRSGHKRSQQLQQPLANQAHHAAPGGIVKGVLDFKAIVRPLIASTGVIMYAVTVCVAMGTG